MSKATEESLRASRKNRAQQKEENETRDLRLVDLAKAQQAEVHIINLD